MDIEWGDPIEYDPLDVLSPEEHEEIRLKDRIEEDRRHHLDRLLWEQFSGHYGRDGSLVIPIRHHGED
jgi:hypothetical protein